MSDEVFDVVIIGAGLSGIGAACHLERECPGKRYVVLEGRDTMGGTWDLFRYPGIRSDSDMHTLGYDFQPWREAKAIADGPAILRYIRDTAAEYGVKEHIRYRHPVLGASWSSDDACWTLDVGGDAPTQIRCNMVLVCTGYYRYDAGFLPHFEGYERFLGEIVHPQHWPEELDYDGKKIVVIGSGATAVTLIPELAKKAQHVVMLQRSPTYMLSMPDTDVIANFLRWLLPDKMAYVITRWKNIKMQQRLYRLSRTRPHWLQRFLLWRTKKALPDDYDVDTHFTPRYQPWDQRLCLVPNDDLFESISSGDASVVTGTIDTFTESGIQLASGETLQADIIITATGLDLLPLGGMDLNVDGSPVTLSERLSYRGLMMSDVPNLVSTFGYVNASWTLRADLTAKYFCRLVNHMDRHGYRQCTPRLRAEDREMSKQPWIIGFSPGYLKRALANLPKQGDRIPWLNPQDYTKDRRILGSDPLEDGVLTFSDNGLRKSA